jgi:hypothetical protein
MLGHAPEFGGHDAETVGHAPPKYASRPVVSGELIQINQQWCAMRGYGFAPGGGADRWLDYW